MNSQTNKTKDNKSKDSTKVKFELTFICLYCLFKVNVNMFVL